MEIKLYGIKKRLSSNVPQKILKHIDVEHFIDCIVKEALTRDYSQNQIAETNRYKDYDEYVGRLSLKQLVKKLEKDGYKTTKIYSYIHSGIGLYIGSNQSHCPHDSCLLGIVFHKEDYDDARLKDIISRWEYFLKGCVYYVEGINSITKE